MAKWDYNCVFYDPDGFAHILNDSRSGFLKCDECGDEIWCHHIEGAVTSRDDAHSLWAIHANELTDGKMEHLIQVPISPTNKLWAEVILYGSDLIPSAMRIELISGGKTRDLGFINKGDGRLVIRQTIFDWFMSLRDYPTCQSSRHGYREEMIWQANIKKEHQKWFEYWCAFANQACVTCFQANMNIDFGDLVPESEKPKFGDFS